MRISIRGVCGKYLFDIMSMPEQFPALLNSPDELNQLGELLLNTLLNFDGQILENDINLPVEFSDAYRKALAVISKEDLKLYENIPE